MEQSIFKKTKPTEVVGRNFACRIALLKGPDLKDITVDARLRFSGIFTEEFFEMVIEIEKIFPAEEVVGIFGADAMNIPGDVYFSGTVLKRNIQPTGGKAGVWEGYLPIQARGLWRRSGGLIAHILPKGNGFVYLLE